mmetsp:Transcript_16482/g.41107  ORF Transcript_16482/g.41107 Transcript_16482/m.41107 type:complete len:213 (-) Transcript_16482:20-658(-)
MPQSHRCSASCQLTPDAYTRPPSVILICEVRLGPSCLPSTMKSSCVSTGVPSVMPGHSASNTMRDRHILRPRSVTSCLILLGRMMAGSGGWGAAGGGGWGGPPRAGGGGCGAREGAEGSGCDGWRTGAEKGAGGTGAAAAAAAPLCLLRPRPAALPRPPFSALPALGAAAAAAAAAASTAALVSDCHLEVLGSLVVTMSTMVPSFSRFTPQS